MGGGAEGVGGKEERDYVRTQSIDSLANFCRGRGHWRRGAWVGDRRPSVAVHHDILASVSKDEGQTGAGEVTGWHCFERRGGEASRHWCSTVVPLGSNEWSGPFGSYCKETKEAKDRIAKG
jgi:hypothetical protein